MQQHGACLAVEDDADEELWSMRDYFWALRLGLIEENTPAHYRAFREGYVDHGVFLRKRALNDSYESH